jgi:hypothetical protein
MRRLLDRRRALHVIAAAVFGLQTAALASDPAPPARKRPTREPRPVPPITTTSERSDERGSLLRGVIETLVRARAPEASPFEPPGPPPDRPPVEPPGRNDPPNPPGRPPDRPPDPPAQGPNR